MKMMFMYLDFVSISFVQHNGGELRRRRVELKQTANRLQIRRQGLNIEHAVDNYPLVPVFPKKDVVLQRRNGKDENERAKLEGCCSMKEDECLLCLEAVFVSFIARMKFNWLNLVPIMLVIKAVDMETDLEVLQMIGRDPQYASLLFPSIERKKMSRFGKEFFEVLVFPISELGFKGAAKAQGAQEILSCLSSGLERNLSFANWDVSRLEMIEKALHSIGLVDNQFLAVPVKSIVDKYPLFPVFPKMMFMYLDFVSISFAQHNGGELRRRRVELKPTANRLQIRRQGLNTEVDDRS
ncbi:hypothetical protein E3N88_05775 [Mikania micrantha]|uniref:Uncharacterized protein n=1 Tax=Mikania micrantha TaxID=192012 RepID=A0A5N6PPU9_9ASTR|nr:hypothetical protein E3N88_05775 [Mikania micrantha]